MTSLSVVMFAYSLMCSCVLHEITRARFESTMRSTLERRIAARQAALATLFGAASGIGLGLAVFRTGDVVLAIVTIILSVGWLYALKVYLEDDDWIDKHKKRFRRRLKNLRRSRTSIATPLPSPAT